MGLRGRELCTEVGSKLALLIVLWAMTLVVTASFAPASLEATAAFIKNASLQGNSIIPLLSASALVALLFLIASTQKTTRRFVHAAELTSDIADTLGSGLFLLGWSTLFVLLKNPDVTMVFLMIFELLVGVALIILSKYFAH